MRITVTLDDGLIEQGQRLTGMSDPTAVIHAGMLALIERERRRRLADLGGTEPQVEDVPRRRDQS